MARSLVRLIVLALALAAGATAGASLWQPAGAAPPPDLAYTAVPPCVVFDSRAAQGATGSFLGPINGGQTVVYDVVGSFATSQGGNPLGTCGIPELAGAVEINVVAVNALSEGNLRVTDGTPGSTGGVVNYNNLTPKLNTSNSVIVPLDALGQLHVTPNCGPGCSADTTEVRGVVLGYFTDGLAARVAQLEALLAGVTRIPEGGAGAVAGQTTLRFSGMNVQIVDGSDSTACTDGTGPAFDAPCNSQGNLVIGYDERRGGTNVLTGSHNLVLGTGGNRSSFGGIVAGQDGTIADDYASVVGGMGNAAFGSHSAVLGGTNAFAGGFFSTVAGGSSNRAEGTASSVSGGWTNNATGSTASVSGGQANVASGFSSSVSGGSSNEASGADCDDLVDASAVTGGENNRASGCKATVTGGGYFNPVNGNHAVGAWSTVTGGDTNETFAQTSTIVGGFDNLTSGGNFGPVVVGGSNNRSEGRQSVVVGGSESNASGEWSVVGGGLGRVATGQYDWKAGVLFQDN